MKTYGGGFAVTALIGLRLIFYPDNPDLGSTIWDVIGKY